MLTSEIIFFKLPIGLTQGEIIVSTQFVLLALVAKSNDLERNSCKAANIAALVVKILEFVA